MRLGGKSYLLAAFCLVVVLSWLIFTVINLPPKWLRDDVMNNTEQTEFLAKQVELLNERIQKLEGVTDE